LSTAYGIVKQDKVFIDVDSTAGKGTTFRIYLPRYNDQSVTSTKPDEAAIQRGRDETVIVVEDDLALLKLTARLLENLGDTVIAANSPIEAVSLAKERRDAVDLLITDVVMPNMNGRDLRDALRTLWPELKCLFMSGYNESVIARQGVLDAGVHFIQKPFSTRDLSTKVRSELTVTSSSQPLTEDK
jgi:two-component system cell cycle sensor histidine kinase/response regulator CckA